MEVEIASSGEILRRLLAGRLQLAIVGTDEADERVELTPFLDDELVGIAKPGTLPLENGLLRRAEVREQLLLCREPGSSTRTFVERALAAAGVETGGRWELGSSEAIKRATREGLGIAFLSRYAVAEEVERDELEVFRLRGVRPFKRQFALATLAGRDLSPAERGFVATLTRCCVKSANYAEACVGGPPQVSRPALLDVGLRGVRTPG